MQAADAGFDVWQCRRSKSACNHYCMQASWSSMVTLNDRCLEIGKWVHAGSGCPWFPHLLVLLLMLLLTAIVRCFLLLLVATVAVAVLSKLSAAASVSAVVWCCC